MVRVFRTGPNTLVWDAKKGGARTALDYAIQSSCDGRLKDLFQLSGAYHMGNGKSMGKGKKRASI